MSAFRAIYRFWVSLLTLAVVVQIGLAGYGAFDTVSKLDGEGKTVDEDSFNDSFGPHTGLGYFIFLGTLVLLLLSFGARGGRILKSLGVVVLVVVQILLAWTGSPAPYAAGALHPINAFIILGLLGSITWREWKVERRAMGEPAPAAAPPA
jgi:hypothetical protein